MDCGIESANDQCCDELALDQFVLSLASVVGRVCGKKDCDSPFDARYDGILLLIDEADNCSDKLHLGTFLKLILERLQRQLCNRILVGLAGLPDVRTRLQESHPSSLRIFEELHLGRLSETEVGGVIDLCLRTAKENNADPTSITDEARSLLCNLS